MYLANNCYSFVVKRTRLKLKVKINKRRRKQISETDNAAKTEGDFYSSTFFTLT